MTYFTAMQKILKAHENLEIENKRLREALKAIYVRADISANSTEIILMVCSMQDIAKEALMQSPDVQKKEKTP